MKRLRHPIRAIEEPFGKAGLIVAVIALVLALTGAAFAAAGLNGKQKKEVEKIAKKFAGKPGAPGAQGAPGVSGANGKDGANGTNGSPGKDGTSATTESFSGSKTIGSAKCEEGGVIVKSASPETAVCNGKKGTTGFTSFLPGGKTETGVISAIQAEGKPVLAPISFPIPLEASIAEGKAHFVTDSEWFGGTAPQECPGTPEAPTAAKGSLCVYEAVLAGEFLGFARPSSQLQLGGADTTGTVLELAPESGSYVQVAANWAVTAE